jgi:hypothetical protein
MTKVDWKKELDDFLTLIKYLIIFFLIIFTAEYFGYGFEITMLIIIPLSSIFIFSLATGQMSGFAILLYTIIGLGIWYIFIVGL